MGIILALAAIAAAADDAPYMQGKRFAVGDYTSGKVCVVEPDGKKVWSFKVPGGGVTHSAARLANGNTLIACGDSGEPCLVEVSPEGQIVWEVSNKDVPGQPLKFLTGFQKLPNGNVLVSNWLGHGHFGEAPHLLEITREKKVVWTYADHRTFKTVATVQVFAEGDSPLSGEGVH